MKAFDLEKALAGEKVVTRDGQEVTQVTLFKGVRKDGGKSICALIDGLIYLFYEDGSYTKELEYWPDLFMAPKKLSGFINVYVTFTTKEEADTFALPSRTACIDLSQFEEGYGL
jgi:hypothetical protein